MFIIPFLIICIFDLLVITVFDNLKTKNFNNATNINFGIALPFSMAIIMIILYISGFLNNLLIGLYTVYLIAILFFIYILKICITKNEKNKNIIEILYKQITSPSFCIFLILYLAIYLYNINASFSNWDEWSHWGPFAKDMFIRNKFYNTDGHIAITHLSYPPFMALFEYFYTKTVGACSMQNLYMAFQTFCFSFYIAIFDNLVFAKGNTSTNKEHKVDNTIQYNTKIILVGISSILVFLLANRVIDFASNPIKSILNDFLLCISFAFFIINILQFDFDDIFKNINLIVIGTLLLFSKQMGAALFLLGIFILFIITIINKNLTKTNFIKGLILFIVPLLFYISWKIEVRINDVHDQFDNIISIKDLFDILFFNGGLDWQKTVKINFLYWLFHKRQLCLTGFEWGIFLLIIITIVSFLQKWKYKRNIFIVSFSMIIGYALYLFGLFCLYLKSFGEYEGTTLACVWRYTSTYLLSIIIYICYIFIEWVIYKRKMDKQSSILLILSMLILILSVSFVKTVDYLPKNIKESDAYIFKEDFEKMEKLEDNSNILIIIQGDSSLTGIKFKYNFFNENKKFTSNSFGKQIYNNEFNRWTKDLVKDEMLNYIKTFDYIYFYKTDDNFWDNYGDLFNVHPEDRGEVYKVGEILR